MSEIAAKDRKCYICKYYKGTYVTSRSGYCARWETIKSWNYHCRAFKRCEREPLHCVGYTKRNIDGTG